MNRDRRQLLGLLPTAFVLGSASSLLPMPAIAAKKAPPRPKAGLVLPLSGASGTVGISMQRAAMLAQSPLARADELIVADSGGTAAGAAAGVALALRGGARVIIGPLFAEESRAAAQAAGGVPVLSFSNDEALIGSGAFLLGITAGQSVSAILRYARGRGVKRVAVLGGSSRWAQQGVATAARLNGAAGLDIRMLAATDGGNLVAALRKAGGGDLPDALLVTEGGDALRTAARATAGSGLQLLGTQQALDLSPGDVAGAWLSGPNPAGLSDFASRYEAGSSNGPGLIAALAYDAMTIVEALRAGGIVDRAALVAKPSFQIVTGPIRFSSDGSAARELAILVADQDGFTLADKSRIAMNSAPEEAGFTLIELIISLALFALIAMAGLALVEALMAIRNRTEGRLDRLAEVQRAMYVIDNDLRQVTTGRVTGNAVELDFSRPLAAEGGLPVQVHYQLGAGTLLRGFRGRGLPQASQRVLAGVGGLRWRYYLPGTGWVDRWPPSPGLVEAWPAAVAADIVLSPGGSVNGTLRRVVLLPSHP